MFSLADSSSFYFDVPSSLAATKAREKNWSQHSLGEPAHWPSSLKHSLSLMYRHPSPSAIFWGSDHLCFYNDAFWHLLEEICRTVEPGSPAAQICGSLWPDLAPKIQEALSSGLTEHLSLHPGPGRGAIYQGLHVPLVGEEGRPLGVFSTWTDLPAAAESAEQDRALTELSPQFVWKADRNGKITYVNQSHLDFLGRPASDVSGDGWLSLVHPDDRAHAARIWQEAASTGSRYSAEFRVQCADGEFRWLQALARPLLTANGHVQQWVGVSFDIHERKLVEQELHRAKEEAERANQLKSTFLANMSHEIRTPLGAMLGFADVLKDPALSPEDRRHYLDILTRNGEQLSSIINDILDLSKVEAGFLNYERRETNPLQIAFDTVSLLDVKAQEKGITLEVHSLPGSPENIISDPIRLKQILLNIVGNAIKFTSKGGVSLYLSGFVGAQGRPGVRFEVKDTGIGLAPDAAADLFQLFHQADTSTARKFGGTGLGLALSRRLARGLGGDVTLLESRAGQGSTFMIEIQSFASDVLDAKSPAQAATPVAKEDKPLLGRRVLVVEDSPDNQKLIQHLLLRRGATVDVACDGEQGVIMALNGHYHVILMDIQMPVMDGYTATRRLRDFGYPGAIIALTAHAMSEVRLRALGAGYTDHLPKPIHAPELIAAVLKHSSMTLSTFAKSALDQGL